MSTPRWEELRAMGDDELIERFDAKAKRTEIGLGFIRDELMFRAQERQTRAMLRYTKRITVMTVVMTLATLANVAVTLGWIG